MTLNDFAQSMALAVGEEYSDSDVATQYQTWTQEALDQINASGRWFHLNRTDTITLGASTATYPLAADVSAVRQVRDPVNNKRLAYASAEELTAWDVNLEEVGTPEYWHHEDYSGNVPRITLVAVPSSSYVGSVPTLKAQVLVIPPALSAGSTIAIPDEFLWVLRHGVLVRVYTNSGQLDAAQLSERRFNEGLELLAVKLGSPVREGSMLAAMQFRSVRQAPSEPSGA